MGYVVGLHFPFRITMQDLSRQLIIQNRYGGCC